MKAYIDGDVVKYRCAFAAEKTKYLVTDPDNYIDPVYKDSAKEAKEAAAGYRGEIWSRKEIQPVENALQATKTCMTAILRHFDSYVVYVSGPTNFRNDVAVTKPYKGNRDRTKDPIYKQEVEEYLIREYGAVRTVDIEADDALGIALTTDPTGCIVTIDKDLDQIAGQHYNFVSGESYSISPRDAGFALYSQLLSGDPTDNIPGLEGVGPAKAHKVLDGSKSNLELAQRAWMEYRSAIDGYERAKAYFLEQLSLVFILRNEYERTPNLPKGFSFDQ